MNITEAAKSGAKVIGYGIAGIILFYAGVIAYGFLIWLFFGGWTA